MLSQTQGLFSGPRGQELCSPSTSRACPAANTRPRRRRVAADALFAPPPFEPEKLTVTFCERVRSAQQPIPRRYTLTHNDITGALQLSVGIEFNYQQISGFYTRLVRDDVRAEWRMHPQPSLHVFCHVSGKERWLAPPSLRNYIFRRELPLVLESFLWAEQQLLDHHPHLADAEVFVHFESCRTEFHKTERWGVFGDRNSWQLVAADYWQRVLETTLPQAGQLVDQLLATGATPQQPPTEQCQPTALQGPGEADELPCTISAVADDRPSAANGAVPAADLASSSRQHRSAADDSQEPALVGTLQRGPHTAASSSSGSSSARREMQSSAFIDHPPAPHPRTPSIARIWDGPVSQPRSVPVTAAVQPVGPGRPRPGPGSVRVRGRR